MPIHHYSHVYQPNEHFGILVYLDTRLSLRSIILYRSFSRLEELFKNLTLVPSCGEDCALFIGPSTASIDTIS